jgi:hypothetical protein
MEEKTMSLTEVLLDTAYAIALSVSNDGNYAEK